MLFEQRFLDKLFLSKELSSVDISFEIELYQPAIEAIKNGECSDAIEYLSNLRIFQASTIPVIWLLILEFNCIAGMSFLQKTLINDQSPRRMSVGAFYKKYILRYSTRNYKKDDFLSDIYVFYSYYLRGIAYWIKNLDSKDRFEINRSREKAIQDFKCALQITENTSFFGLNESIYNSIESLLVPPLFRYSFQHSIRAIVKGKIQEVKSLDIVKRETLRTLINHEIILTSRNLDVLLEKMKSNDFIYIVGELGTPLFVVLAIIIFLFCYILPARFFLAYGEFNFSLLEWFLYGYIMLLFSFLPVLPLFFTTSNRSRRYENLNEFLNKKVLEFSRRKKILNSVRKIISWAWFLGVETVYIVLFLRVLDGKIEVNLFSYLFLSGTQGYIVFFVIILLSISVFFILQSIFFAVPVNLCIRSYQTNKQIISLLASKISKVLVLGAKKDWTKIEDRNEIIKSLFQVSRLFKSKNLQLVSARNKYMSQRNLKIANYIEGLTIWVALPKRDTKEYFCYEINEILEMLLSGDWDALVKRAMDSPDKSTNIIKTIKFTLVFRSLLASILPLVIVLLLRGDIQSSKVLGFSYELLLLATTYWAIVSLLTILDPELRGKIEASQTFFEIFSNFFPWNWGK